MKRNIKYLIKAALLFGLIGALVIACAKSTDPETSSAGISISDVIENAADGQTAMIGSAPDDDNTILDNPRITITTNYQPAVFSLERLLDKNINENFTNQQLREIAQKLGIPDNLKIGVAVGDPYVWEAAGIRIADVSFYLGDTFIAGAECEVHTSNLARSIYKYEY